MMSAEGWSVVVAGVAIVVSVGSAIYTFWQSRHLAGSGFKAAEDLKADLVALLAALRSIIYKGISSSQDNKSRDISVELKRVREFQTSPSGYALAALAAERGAGKQEDAGHWRVLGLQFAELAGMQELNEGDASVVLRARNWSTEIETTLGGLTLDDVEWMASKVGNLPSMTTSLRHTRSRDMVLRSWFEISEERRAEADPQINLRKLLTLKARGVEDPDVDLWIALLNDDKDNLQKALDAGAHVNATMEHVLGRHREQLGSRDSQ
jgi:hypothetical protein